MKPKFALDLSHEGINLLHRSKGGWSLVGSVDLDDPEMGAHLADLRRRAAALESGGFTCKIIIPNSQVLYTTLEAPGPDDISREVQIRSGLDGLTPYPVGELVFDWRAAGERARVAVLARETMDEAETFAVEHHFNPVSFVARSAQSEFSGEPFFGKTRAAAKILGPTERVEPDASPVPRKPPAIETRPAFGTTPISGTEPHPEPQAAPHSPGDLAWQPAAEPEPTPTAAKSPAPAPAAAPISEPRNAPFAEPDPDDPFAELDKIQAELSGEPGTVPAFRSRTRSPQPRPARSDQDADQLPPPPLAPFPPTSDEADALPTPSPSARKARPAGKPTAADETSPSQRDRFAQQHPSDPGDRAISGSPTRADQSARPSGETGAQTTRPAPNDGEQDARPPAKDDTPGKPGVAFSTRRGSSGTATVATPTARKAVSEPAPSAQAAAPAQPASPAPAQPTDSGSRREATPSDRRRAEMAEALSRPLPGKPSGSSAPKAPEKPGTRGSLSDAVRGAAGGLRSFGQRRASEKTGPKPADTSMTALMRGAGSSEARVSPEQQDDGPDLLAPDIAATETAQKDAPSSPATASEPPVAKNPTTPAPQTPPAPQPAKQEKAKQTPAPSPSPAITEPTKPAIKSDAKPAIPPAQDKPKILARAAASEQAKPSAPVSEAEALTVFGARRTEANRGGRKYLGVVLTLLLLLAMAVIAMWSTFFVDEGDPALFNDTEGAATSEATEPNVETALPGDSTLDTPPPATEVLPDGTAPDDTATEAPVPDAPEATLTPQVLSEDEAAALYAETQVWQRAPETLGEPFTPGLEMGATGSPGTARGATAELAAIAEPDLPASPSGGVERAAPLPPPPADTVFELDENGLVNPSPDGTVSPTGIIIFEGAPDLVPPVRPGTAAPPETSPEDAVLDDAALEQAVEQAVEAAAALTTDTDPVDVPDLRPEPRPEDVPATEETDPATTDPDEDAQLDVSPEDVPNTPEIEIAAADPASIEAAVDAVAASFVDATDLAVATSLKPTRRPDDIEQIVNAAMARAAAAPPAPAAPDPSATTTPAIPTSASVAEQATTPNALNLREINLLGISGPSNARRALVRMENGRYITVKVGDRLDGGRVTSITSDGLTYQKGARNFTLQLLPLG